MMQRKNFEIMLGVVSLGLLIVTCIYILAPFFSALLWAAILVFSTRNIYKNINMMFNGRKWLTAGFLIVLIISLIVLPLAWMAINFGANAVVIASSLNEQLKTNQIHLPEWITHAPWIGEKINIFGRQLLSNDPAVREQLNGFLLWLAGSLLKIGLAAGHGIAMMLFSSIIAIFLYVSMDEMSILVHSAMHRISGSRAEHLLSIAGSTVYGVVVGILGTAVTQGVLTGVGLVIAGVPGALSLTLVAIVISLLPAGTALVWGPAALWLYHEGHTGMMWFIIAWGIGVVGMADNFIKPWLIGQNSNLPFLLIVIGVMGGAINFGVLGIFLGPVFLALGYTLLRDWLLSAQSLAEDINDPAGKAG